MKTNKKKTTNASPKTFFCYCFFDCLNNLLSIKRKKEINEWFPCNLVKELFMLNATKKNLSYYPLPLILLSHFFVKFHSSDALKV